MTLTPHITCSRWRPILKSMIAKYKKWLLIIMHQCTTDKRPQKWSCLCHVPWSILPELWCASVPSIHPPQRLKGFSPPSIKWPSKYWFIFYRGSGIMDASNLCGTEKFMPTLLKHPGVSQNKDWALQSLVSTKMSWIQRKVLKGRLICTHIWHIYEGEIELVLTFSSQLTNICHIWVIKS